MQENSKDKQMMEDFGIYRIMEWHPRNPGKVRIAFGCSENFGGACLNNKLMFSFDLSNQLAGVLLQFRSDKVAFMGDIETMFYQLQVLDNQKDFLRYLWRENNNLEGDFDMCVHVFDGTSSPGCWITPLEKLLLIMHLILM